MSYDIIKEDDVPGFIRRLGDHVFQGSNNTVIILGTDRAKKGPATINDGLGQVGADGGGKKTGTIHMIAGRQDKDGNPDLDKDSAYIYLSMKTNVDDNLGLGSVVAATNSTPAAIMKSDAVRIVYRKNLKACIFDGSNYVYMDDKVITLQAGKAYVTIKDGKVTIDADSVELGAGATEKLILGDSFKKYFLGHTHPSPVGPTGPPIQPWNDSQLLSQRKVTVK